MAKKNEHSEIIKIMQDLDPTVDLSEFIYKNNKTKSTVICSCGNKYEITYSNFKKGKRCPECKRKKLSTIRPLDYEIVLKTVEDRGYKLIRRYTKDNYSRVVVECSNGHEWDTRIGNIRNGRDCPHCRNYKSKPEYEIIEFIKTFYDGEIEHSNRNIIDSPFSSRYLELDIYLPDLRFAIEYNGTYWHSDDKLIKNGWLGSNHKHKYKYDECFKRNIFLLHIDEIDYINDKEDIFDKIKKHINLIKRI